MKILAEEATIKTAAVEIKALMISGKQVTLAVFRQLENENVIVDGDGCYLEGTVWGRVNYHPDKECQSNLPHFHVVWQKGDELRRATIYYARKYPEYQQYSRRKWEICSLDAEAKYYIEELRKQGRNDEAEAEQEVLNRLASDYSNLVKELKQLPQLFIAV